MTDNLFLELQLDSIPVSRLLFELSTSETDLFSSLRGFHPILCWGIIVLLYSIRVINCFPGPFNATWLIMNLVTSSVILMYSDSSGKTLEGGEDTSREQRLQADLRLQDAVGL